MVPQEPDRMIVNQGSQMFHRFCLELGQIFRANRIDGRKTALAHKL